MRKVNVFRVVTLAVSLALCQAPCRAQAVPYQVILDTGPLNGLGPFYLEFQLLDGSGAGDGNSRAVVTNFALTGGNLGGILPPIGSVSGSLAGALTLTDGPASFGELADFAQAFSVASPTSRLSFDLDLIAAAVDTPAPDIFSLLILDGSLAPIATNGPSGIEFVTAEFQSTEPVPVGYSSTIPILTAVVTPVPEPSALTLVGVGALSVLAYGWRRKWAA